jgi:hypothetical protein
MEFTSSTEIAKKWAKVFTQHDEITILKNNNFLGIYLGWALGKAILDSGIINQIREELWELGDAETSSMVDDYKKNGLWAESQNFSDFLKSYNV